MRDTAEARQYFEKGKKLLSTSRYDSAFFYLNQCEKLLEKHLRANDPFRLQSRITLAASRQYLGDFNQALKIYRSILEDIDEQKNEDDYVKVQNNIASIYKDLFDTQNAQITFEWILQNRIKKYGEKHPEVVSAYVKLGANCNDFKDSLHYEKGLAYFSKALAIQRQLEPSEGFEHYRILEEISEIYRSQGHYQKAIPILKKVLAYRQKHLSPNDPYIGDAHFYLAKNYILAENWEKAFLHLDADLRILRETYGANHPYFADDLLDKAKIFRKQGNFKKALELIAEITHLLIPGFSPDGNESPKEALLNAGYFQQKKLIGVFEEKANILTSGPAGFNDKKTALESLDMAIQLIEETRQVYQEQGSKITLYATYRPVFEHALKLSLELWEQTHDPSYSGQAFTIMEKSKVATLRDAIHAKSAIEFSNIPSRFSEK